MANIALVFVYWLFRVITISTVVGKRKRVRPKAPTWGAVGKSRTA